MEHPNDRMTKLPGPEALQEEIDRRMNRQEQFAIAVFDVDDFARLNHDLWHVEGDRMLVQLAQLLSQSALGSVYRTGGGEFTVLAPQVSREEALAAAEKMRALVAAADFALADGRQVTVTVGVAHAPQDSGQARALLDAAKAALFYGKQNGRNQAALPPP